MRKGTRGQIPRPPEFLVLNAVFFLTGAALVYLAFAIWGVALLASILTSISFLAAVMALGWLAAYVTKKSFFNDTP
jgi:VIT1/CCC1 family predicted Fe2+/Mn2+ transporter